jgi:pimeloyl-ACP methyl ester carboxylesterase
MRDWIFIRGLVREAGHWGDFPDAFRAAFPGDRVRCVDLPGNGVHHQGKTPLTVATMAEQVRKETLDGGATRPYLLALSLGGMVACDWAQRRPEELSGVVLVNTSFGGYSPPHHRFRPGAVLPTLRSLRARDLVHRERQQLAITSSRTELHHLVAPRWAGIARARPVSRKNGLRQMIAALRFRPSRTAPELPLLLLCGGGDRLVEPRCSQVIAEAWGAPLRMHPTAGHDLSLDAGPWMLEQIRAWLPAQP